MDVQDSFGQWVKERRKELDLTQEELAGLVSCSPVTIRKIEANQRRPSKQMADGLARALQVDTLNDKQFLAEARRITPHPPSFPDARISLPGIWLVKRPAEIAAVCSLLRQPDIHLLTLTGPGGVGKTRLATQAAWELQAEFADGAYLIDLSPIFQPELLLTTIALGLGLAAPDEHTARQRLSGYLRDKQALLVLDNFEQILEAAPRLAAWLGTVPGLKVLVTSRARLHLSVEVEYSVPSMTLPNLSSLPAPEELLTQSPAVELFTVRVRATQPAFRLTDENAYAVVQICTLLDGLPLAIELAAARCNLLTPASLLERLHQFHPLRLLTGGPQDLPARQQTLQRTIDWSYSLLSEAERLLFERLGVFAGGATLEAIEAICGNRGDLQVLDNLQTLIHHSLIRHSPAPNESPRFQMLVIFREYALEHLEQRGELEIYRHKHAAYFEAWATVILPELYASRRVAAISRLESDLDNLRVALDWCCSSPADLEIGMRLANHLREFWMLSRLEEGRTWIQRLLIVYGNAEPTLLKAHLLNSLGHLIDNLYEQDTSIYYNESLEIFRAFGDRFGEASVLHRLGQMRLYEDLEQNRSYLEESLRLFRELNTNQELVWVLHNQANLALHSGNLTLAQSIIHECLQLFQQADDSRGIALCHIFYGKLAQQRGDAPTAIQSFKQAIELSRQYPSVRLEAWTDIILAKILLKADDVPAATRCLLESLQLFHRESDPLGISYSLTGLARVDTKSGTLEQAAQKLGAASAFFRQFQAYSGQENEYQAYFPIEHEMERFAQDKFNSIWRDAQETPIEPEIRKRLGREKFERLWREGYQEPARIIKSIDDRNFGIYEASGS